MENMSAYSAFKLKNDMRGFYVASDNREIMKKMEALLKTKGYFAYVDTSGRLNYLIDGRKNIYKAGNVISKIAEKEMLYNSGRSGTAWEIDEKRLRRLIQEKLKKLGFKIQHRGSAMIEEAVLYGLRFPERIVPMSYYIYPLLSEKFKVRARQVDRLIRYAIKAAGANMGNGDMVRMFCGELESEIKNTN